MRAFEVSWVEIIAGVPVARSPYPHISLGDSGRKKATWVAIRKSDAGVIVQPSYLPCPNRRRFYFTTRPEAERVCKKCGKQYGPWECDDYGFISRHPDAGEMEGPMRVFDVDLIKDGGKYIIIAPCTCNGADDRAADDRALVLWRVPRGNWGKVKITSDEGVTVIATEFLDRGRGLLGETAEILAVLKPGQELVAAHWDEAPKPNFYYTRLRWDGKNIEVIFG